MLNVPKKKKKKSGKEESDPYLIHYLYLIALKALELRPIPERIYPHNKQVPIKKISIELITPATKASPGSRMFTNKTIEFHR